LGALKLVLRAEFRRRWRSWLALAALIAVVSGLVLFASAAGRRTASALPRFIAAHGYDSAVYSSGPLPALAKLPNVVSTVAVIGEANGQPTCTCKHLISSDDLDLTWIPAEALSRFTELISGHMLDQSSPDQVLASFTLQQDYGVRVGTVITIPLYARSQLAALNNAVGAPPAPRGPTVSLRVVGIEAAETEFPSGQTPVYDLYATSAFARSVLPRTAAYPGYLVRLRHGQADYPLFQAEAKALGVEGAPNLDTPAALVESSVHPQAVGWWVLAVLAGLAGLAVISQALSRQSVVEGEDYPTYGALGLSTRQLTAIAMARTVVVAFLGAAGGVVIAVLLSPLAPVGEARWAEPSRGISLDGLVLFGGSLASLAVVLLLGLRPASRIAHLSRSSDDGRQHKPSVAVEALAASGATPAMLVGARHALERGQGSSSVPVGTALLGSVLAVAALCATAVFGASLSHLTTTPSLYGDSFQLVFYGAGYGGPGVPTAKIIKALERNPAVARISIGFGRSVSIDGTSVQVLAGEPIRGPVLLSTVTGKFPSAESEIALGSTTLRDAGAHLGSTVPVIFLVPGGGTRTVPLRVVGEIAFPIGIGNEDTGLGTGAAMSINGFRAATCPSGRTHEKCLAALNQQVSPSVLISTVPGPRGRAAVAHYLSTFPEATSTPTLPGALVNFGEAVNFPLIVGMVLALFGVATLVHLLVVSVGRRRQEMGLLKALGFVNSQVAAAVCWQATTVALVGIIVGVPLGVAVGDVVWRAFATNLGVVPFSVMPVLLIAGLVAGALVVANLIAVAPALTATRCEPGELLRAQ
jgi:ABC-type lipoprotein release transport system permease subunit